ncbi:MAG: ribosomal RNA small subunit methyltransferase A [Planctomycetes bacterium]|nr:ribosomal RNA small subunit methyltransferase A [Planctomycetota bacterium]
MSEEIALQTKHEIAQLLASAGTRPNKKLGQNFLIDLNLMRKLITAADIRPDDIVLEVGCGTGSFTEELIKEAGSVVGVEFDKTLAWIVKGRLETAENAKIINADILENKNRLCAEAVTAVEQAKKQFGGRILLVANLPYGVAAAVMANLITAAQLAADVMYVTVQKEVAERMTANPGDHRYGTLSILMDATGETEILRILPASVFWPRPKVESAMVKFLRNETKASRIKDMQLFREVVSLFMGHRRKMVKAATKFAEGRLAKITDWQKIFETCQINPKARPQTLSAEDYIAITEEIRKSKE